jgi:hypothetical protein
MFIAQVIPTDTLQIASNNSANNQKLAILILVLAITLIILVILINSTSKKKKKSKKVKKENSKPVPNDREYEIENVRHSGKAIREEQPVTNPQPPIKNEIQQESNHEEITSDTTPSQEQESIRTNHDTTSSAPPTIKPPKVKVNPKTIFVNAEEEKGNKIKFIGYEPNDFFLQNDPLNYPYVIMPRPRSVIKFPRKNKTGNKGYSEDFFLEFINQYFKLHFKIYNDRILIIPSKQNPYEPDIVLIDEKVGLNLFIDIEIDEPYDGITREPMHFRGYDKERNKFFKNRGWLTVRFAEEQVRKYPESSCKFLFHVVNSINEKYKILNELETLENIGFIPQWTIEQAKEWSDIKYRESYLGIDSFDIQNTHKELKKISDSELEDEIEKQVNEKGINHSVNLKEAIVKQAINTGKFISCKFSADSVYTILQPESFDGKTLNCYCYLKNRKRELGVKELTDLIIRDQPFLIRINGEIGVEEIKRVVNDAIQNKKLIRMKYTRSSWTEQIVDEETGEIILNHTEAEQSLRTISDVNYSINVLNEEHFAQYNLNSEDYITAFCHKREEQRTFRFDRINELEILNI